jgi:hypothetical protein
MTLLVAAAALNTLGCHARRSYGYYHPYYYHPYYNPFASVKGFFFGVIVALIIVAVVKRMRSRP